MSSELLDKKAHRPRIVTRAKHPRHPLGLLRAPRFRAIVLGVAALGLTSVADAFFYLRIQRDTSMSPSLFPLLYVGTAVTYLLLAIPAGRLGDRIGRGRVFLLGHGLLVAACLAPFALPSGSSEVTVMALATGHQIGEVA